MNVEWCKKGHLKNVYLLFFSSLMKELQLRNVFAESQVPIPLNYKGFSLSKDFRMDILVEKEIILELKTVESLLPIHEAQIISYLKLADKRLGFLINFNVPIIKNGFRRFVNNY
ncbi:MAG: GxxExxY protein [Arcicella sp.]|nr:GxxExxY protein [Arcicella sp.]